MSLTEQDCNSTEQCHIWLQLQQSVAWNNLARTVNSAYLLVIIFYYYLRQRGYVFICICVSVCLSVCLSVGDRITQKLLTKSYMKFCGMTGNNPGTNRLDYCGNPDWYPDPGIL